MVFEIVFAGAVFVFTAIMAFLFYKGGITRRRIAAALGISEKITGRNHLLRGISGVLLIIFFAVGLLLPAVSGYKKITIKTGDILFLVDESRSMAAKKQLSQPSQLEQAREIMVSFADAFPNLNVAVYGFTREVRSHLFWTEDYNDFKNTVRGVVSIEGVPTNGTDLGKAIEGAVNYFPAESNSKIIVLLSDGDNRADKDLLKTAISKARERNVKIIVIGIGEKEGSFIPIYNRRGSFAGFEEEEGQRVIVLLDESSLKEIALASGGIYIEGDDPEKAFEFLDRALVKKEKNMPVQDAPARKYLILFSLVPLFFLTIKNW